MNLTETKVPHQRRALRPIPARAASVGAFAISALAAAWLHAVAVAGEFSFSPACGSNSGLFSCCMVNAPEGVGCRFDKRGDPVAFIFVNNWGFDECGACPGPETFPGPGDCINLGLSIGTLVNSGLITFACISSAPDGGGLQLTNSSINAVGDFSVFNLDLMNGGASCGGTLTIGSLNWLSAVSGSLTAQEFCLGDAMLAASGGHTFNNGPVKNTGTATWSAGNISLAGGSQWTNLDTFTISCNPPATRTFNGGAFNNCGMLCTSNNNPPGGVCTVNFNSNSPVHTTGSGRLSVGPKTTLGLLGAGSIFPDPFAEPSEVGDGATLRIGGPLSPFILRDGTVINDTSGNGSATVEAFNVRIPPGESVVVHPRFLVIDNTLEIFGVLEADFAQMSGSAVLGAGTGSVVAQDLWFDSSIFQVLNEMDVLVKDALTVAAPGVELDGNSKLTLGNGVDAATGLFDPSVGTTTTLRFRVDPGEIAQFRIAPNAYAECLAPSATFFSRIGTGDADLIIDGILSFRSASTSIPATMQLFIGRSGELSIGPCPDNQDNCSSVVTVFSEADLEGSLVIKERTKMIYGGPGFNVLGDEAVLEILGTLETTLNQNNPFVHNGAAQVYVGPAGKVVYNQDTVTSEGGHVENDGTMEYRGGKTITLSSSCSGSHTSTIGVYDDHVACMSGSRRNCDKRDGSDNDSDDDSDDAGPEFGFDAAGAIEIDDSTLILSGMAIRQQATGVTTITESLLTFDCIDVVNEGLVDMFESTMVIEDTLTLGGSGSINLSAVEIQAGDGVGNEKLLTAAEAKIRILDGTTTFKTDVDIQGELEVDSPDAVVVLGPLPPEAAPHIESLVIHDGSVTFDSILPQQCWSVDSVVLKPGGVMHWTLKKRTKVIGYSWEELAELGLVAQWFGSDRDAESDAVGVEAPAIQVVTGFFVFAATNEAGFTWDPGTVLELAGGVGADVGDWEQWTRLEVGGTDLGHVPAGFNLNFDLSILRIGAGAHAYLQDLFDNGNRGAGGEPEALYVDTLEFADTQGQLNLNGLNIYFGALIGDPSQIINVPVVLGTPGDINNDGFVEGTDLALVLGTWGICGACAADLNGDGIVNGADLAIVLGHWTG